MNAKQTNDTRPTKSIAVIGAGLSGCMVAALLADMGFQVSVFEKRPEVPADEKASGEFGFSANASKRSINLALSQRGIVALERLNLMPEVLKTAIRMPRRVIHSVDGEKKLQAYGRLDQCLYSVSRNGLNDLIKEYIRKADKGVQVRYGCTLTSIDRDGNCVFQTPAGEQAASFDLVVGADGAFSAVRECLLKQGRISFARKFIRHGYKELCIPAVPDAEGRPQFALSPSEGLHIWPRGDFMLIALPNPDKTFTATLFAPYNGPQGFDHVDVRDEQAILRYFQQHFPDALRLMPSAVQDFRSNPVGSLMTLRVDPWNFGKVVLIGDAAHAVVPFFGQGMNAAFQDACLLADTIAQRLSTAALFTVDLPACIDQFAKERAPATNALADLSLEHYRTPRPCTPLHPLLYRC